MSIKNLNVSWNGFGNEGSLAMAEALKFNSTVQWLDMSNNRIMDEGALLLSKGLEVNDSLKVLKVRWLSGCWCSGRHLNFQVVGEEL